MTTASAPPRIAPLDPPYEPELDERLRRWMPPGTEDVEPLKLFRTLARNPELMSRMLPLGAGLLAHGQLEPRDRELVIHRACARASAEYEWGVHVVGFGRRVGLTDEQLRATADGGPEDFEGRDALLVAATDAIHDTADLPDDLFGRLAAELTTEQLIEFTILASWYRLISGVINVARIELEPWGERW